MKDEIIGELDDFMTEINDPNSNEYVKLPDQFDDVVDIVVDQKR